MDTDKRLQELRWRVLPDYYCAISGNHFPTWQEACYILWARFIDA